MILGTTDTDYEGAPEDVRTGPEDVSYILDVTNRAFPSAHLTQDDVVSSWAGLRPLIADSRGGPSDISRTHEIRSSAPGWWDVAGGKLTTYRLMAEQTISRVQRYLGTGLTRCTTAEHPLLEEVPDTAYSALVPPDLTREAVMHYCQNEWAVHLDDVMLRRAGWHYYRQDSAQTAETVSVWMGDAHAWDDETRKHELERLRAQTERR